MSLFDTFIICIVLLLVFGPLLPLIPFLWMFGRTLSLAEAKRTVPGSNKVVTYNREMGPMHRIWVSDIRPVNGHWRALTEGMLVWMPFASHQTAKRHFGRHLVVATFGSLYDTVAADGQTLFDHYWRDYGPNATRIVDDALNASHAETEGEKGKGPVN